MQNLKAKIHTPLSYSRDENEISMRTADNSREWTVV